jgi:hypothetical protein
MCLLVLVFTIADWNNAKIKIRLPITSIEKNWYFHTLLISSTNLKYIKKEQYITLQMIIMVILLKSVSHLFCKCLQ